VSLTDYSVASAGGSLIMAAKELLPPGMGDESIPKLPRSPRGTLRVRPANQIGR
jgi:hypothetical protein